MVEAVGPDVTGLAVGDRVAYCMSMGSYAEHRLIPARMLVRIPDTVTDRQAAAMLLKGCTVQYLIRQIYPVAAGDTILFHAAAGGCGLIACQWARHLGATVIGTVSTPEKAELARAHGCDHPIVYTQENFTKRVMEITHGNGVPVVFDSVGKDTFLGSARLSATTRPDGQLRQRVGRRRAVQPRPAGREGVPVLDPPHSVHLHQHP